MKNLIMSLLVLSSASMLACTKNSSALPDQVSSTPETNTQTTSMVTSVHKEDSTFVLQKSYIGTNLTLIYPHPANWGFIHLSGEQAKVIYNHLQIKEVSKGESKLNVPSIGELNVSASREKTAANITCFAPPKGEVDSPEKYSCSLYIEYRRGRINYDSSMSPSAPATAIPKTDYVGPNVFLSGSDNQSPNWISIVGTDAKVLFDTLEVDEFLAQGNAYNFYEYLNSIHAVQTDASKTTAKVGTNIACFKELHDNQNLYLCMTGMNLKGVSFPNF